MNSIKHRFTLDMHSAQSQISIPAMLGDTGRTLYITLTDGGNPYTIADGCLAKLAIKRPTGTHLEAFCEIVGGTTIVYKFSQNENTCAVEGLHDCTLTLYGAEDEIITSPRFTMVVNERAVNSDDINLSDEDQSTIDAIVSAEAARQITEASRVNAEALRVDAEALREEAESARKTAESARTEAEAIRIPAEQARTEAETARATAESARQTAETERATAETERKTAESARGTSFSALEKSLAEAITKALNAEAGFPPIVEFQKDDHTNATILTITDKDGAKMHYIYDGKDGKDGRDGLNGLDGTPVVANPEGAEEMLLPRIRTMSIGNESFKVCDNEALHMDGEAGLPDGRNLLVGKSFDGIFYAEGISLGEGLRLNGSKLELDLPIYGGEMGEVDSIRFTIEGVTYTAKDGWTWADWIESEYNTDGYYIGEYDYIYSTDGSSLQDGTTKAWASDTITDGTAYQRSFSTRGVQ